MSILRRIFRPFRAPLLTLVLLTSVAAPARASAPLLVAPVPTPGIALASDFSWNGFTRYWKGFINRTDHVVIIVVLVGATALFIITRGKWLK